MPGEEIPAEIEIFKRFAFFGYFDEPMIFEEASDDGFMTERRFAEVSNAFHLSPPVTISLDSFFYQINLNPGCVDRHVDGFGMHRLFHQSPQSLKTIF